MASRSIKCLILCQLAKVVAKLAIRRPFSIFFSTKLSWSLVKIWTQTKFYPNMHIKSQTKHHSIDRYTYVSKHKEEWHAGTKSLKPAGEPITTCDLTKFFQCTLQYVLIVNQSSVCFESKQLAKPEKRKWKFRWFIH